MQGIDAVQSHVRRFRHRNPAAVGIGGLFLFLAIVRVWAVLVGAGYAALRSAVAGWPEAPILFGTIVTFLVGFGLPALASIRLRGLAVPVTLPVTTQRWAVLAFLLSPVVLVAAVSLLGPIAFGRSVAELAQRSYSPHVGVLFLVQTTVIPALVRGLGVGLLFFGVVHTRLRTVTSPSVAVGLTAVVAGVFVHLPMETLRLGRVDAVMLALFAVSVLASLFIGLTLGLCYRGLTGSDQPTALRWREVPVVFLGALGALAVIDTMVRDPGFVLNLLWLVVISIGALGYNRTRSVWTPVAMVVAYRLSIGAAVFLEMGAAASL